MSWVADAVLVVHASIVLFIVGGLVAIWVGAGLHWSWVRERGFRIVHLCAIGVVAALALLDVACPLTVLEDALRHDSEGSRGFIQRWVGRLLYYELPSWVFSLAHVTFAAVVGLTWRLVPPWRRRHSC